MTAATALFKVLSQFRRPLCFVACLVYSRLQCMMEAKNLIEKSNSSRAPVGVSRPRMFGMELERLQEHFKFTPETGSWSVLEA